jgi:hypothetical protein
LVLIEVQPTEARTICGIRFALFQPMNYLAILELTPVQGPLFDSKSCFQTITQIDFDTSLNELPPRALHASGIEREFSREASTAMTIV